ncbi:MAG: RNA polymerase subunit sigma-24 [Acidobacteria bacterium]|nr:MAG: RNA polymerase subunit sigma-24 [Acidobacteriota bacterium]
MRRYAVHRQRTAELCELPESKVIRMAQRGDEGAFERLYTLHSGRVYALCMRMLRNPDEAEDSTQEVFLHVFRKIQGFRGASAFSTWLHRVAVNTVLMRIRGSKLAKATLVENPESDEETGMRRRELGAPDLHLEGYIDRVAIENAIKQLPPRCKLMFVLYDIQGYAHSEIAKLLGCSVGNAKSQLHKARVRLRKLLRPEMDRNEAGKGSPGLPGPEAGHLDGSPFLHSTELCQSLQ